MLTLHSIIYTNYLFNFCPFAVNGLELTLHGVGSHNHGCNQMASLPCYRGHSLLRQTAPSRCTHLVPMALPHSPYSVASGPRNKETPGNPGVSGPVSSHPVVSGCLETSGACVTWLGYVDTPAGIFLSHAKSTWVLKPARSQVWEGTAGPRTPCD